ncbi:serine/threonine protein kinase [Parendozoicomonas haliclonae]|uniref:serine/threonine protein kinase n=1 Tax=Parendozoicomonas haliclonae TaxID=1960125 RepID=UPI001056D017|nr:serine/threonine protein kinase [Parendozoicomonas haliclonae]
MKGPFGLSVRLPDGHPLTEVIQQRLTEAGFLGGVTDTLPDVDSAQSFQVFHDSVDEISFTAPLARVSATLTAIPEEQKRKDDKGDGRSWYKLNRKQPFVVAAGHDESTRIWRDLLIETETDSDDSDIRWLLFKPQPSASKTLEASQTLPEPLFTPYYNVYDKSEDPPVYPIDETRLQSLTEEFHSSDDIRNPDLEMLVAFYRRLERKTQTLVTSSGAEGLPFPEKAESYNESAYQEYKKLTWQLELRDVFYWAYLAGVPWNQLQELSEYWRGNPTQHPSESPEVDRMLKILAGMPKNLVKGAMAHIMKGYASSIRGSALPEPLLKQFVDRLTVLDLKSPPQNFIGRYDIYDLLVGVTSRDGSSIKSYMQSVYRTYRFVSNSDSGKMSHNHWLMAVTERMRQAGELSYEVLNSAYGHHYPARLPSRDQVRQTSEQLSTWWEEMQAQEATLVSIPRGYPYQSVYFQKVEPDRHVNSQDDFSLYHTATLPGHTVPKSLKLWREDITLEARQNELAFYQALDRLSSSLARPKFIPAVDRVLLHSGDEFDGDLAGLVLPQVSSSMAEAFQPGTDLPVRQKLEVLIQTAAALEWLHGKDIVLSHIDNATVKTALLPANIRINEVGAAVCTSLMAARITASHMPFAHFLFSPEDMYPQAVSAVQMDTMAFGRFIAELVLEKSFPYFSQAIDAAQNAIAPQENPELDDDAGGERGEEEARPQPVALTTEDWLKRKLLSFAVLLLQAGEIDLPYIRNQLTEFRGLFVQPAPLPFIAMPLQPAPAINVVTPPVSSSATSAVKHIDPLNVGGACNVCFQTFTSQDRSRNAMRFLLGNGELSKIYCRACSERLLQGGDTDPITKQPLVQMMRDVGGPEDLGELMEAEEQQKELDIEQARQEQLQLEQHMALQQQAVRPVIVAPPVSGAGAVQGIEEGMRQLHMYQPRQPAQEGFGIRLVNWFSNLGKLGK